VRDAFSLQLLLKRKSPDAVLIALKDDGTLELPEEVQQDVVVDGHRKVILIAPNEQTVPSSPSLRMLPVIHRPYSRKDLDRVLGNTATPLKHSHPINDSTSTAEETPQTIGTH
jgi:hypothetical protein